MIQLELKAKHFYLIADILINEYNRYSALQIYLAKGASVGVVANISQPVIDEIKTACQGVQDDDLVTVETDAATFIGAFNILAQKPEGSYNDINTEMMDLLTPQITAGVAANNPEWISLSQQVTDIRTANLQVVADTIQSGKDKLYPQV